jgi:DNA-binding transcriptional regulator YdaS (Cro superfamily)
MDNPMIKAAVDEVGGAARVAERLEISRISVYEWISKGRLPSDRVIPLAELTDWKYTPHQLDPLLYPNPTDGIPPAILAES